MPWFRHHGKPYLLAKEAKGRQRHTRRPRREPRHPRSKVVTKTSPLSTPTQEQTLMATPPSSQYGSTYYRAFINLVIFTQAPNLAPYFSIYTSTLGIIFGPPPPSPTYYMLMPLMFQMTMIHSTTYM
ncbi:hypothetical protein PVK06_020988 [Gossypium arboreum]|uniref:Uncharacterized protein n=1 Tax=Gossypium arboreum TaxID=29729 RepID=A0ABR0PPH1_GOSAR|nr:hypothetical protein PVK06_020988 [Gossypium arboreum]